MEKTITEAELAAKLKTVLEVTEAGSRRREWALGMMRLIAGDEMVEAAIATLADEAECRPII